MTAEVERLRAMLARAKEEHARAERATVAAFAEWISAIDADPGYQAASARVLEVCGDRELASGILYKLKIEAAAQSDALWGIQCAWREAAAASEAALSRREALRRLVERAERAVSA